MLGDDPLIGRDAARATLVERPHRLAEQLDRLDRIVQDDRLVDVELEVALRAGEGHRVIVAEDLDGHHRQRLRLRGIDLARHDRGAGLVLGNRQLAQPGARPRGIPAYVVGDLHEGPGQRAQGAARRHHRVVGGQRGELVGRLDERLAGLARDLGCRPRAEPGMRVQPGADGGAAQGQRVEARQRGAHAGRRLVELRHPARDHLAERQRGGILQVRAPDHHEASVRARLGVERVAQGADGGQERLGQRQHGRHVHHGREHVVGRLAAVDVVVGMDRLLAARHAARELDGAVGDDLVGVHVRLGAGARLEDDERELLVPPSRDHLVGRARDEVGLVGRQLAERAVGERRRLLHDTESADHTAPPVEPAAPDREVLQRALGLGAPETVGGDLDGAERVVFGAGLRHAVQHTPGAQASAAASVASASARALK